LYFRRKMSWPFITEDYGEDVYEGLSLKDLKIDEAYVKFSSDHDSNLSVYHKSSFCFGESSEDICSKQNLNIGEFGIYELNVNPSYCDFSVSKEPVFIYGALIVAVLFYFVFGVVCKTFKLTRKCLKKKNNPNSELVYVDNGRLYSDGYQITTQKENKEIKDKITEAVRHWNYNKYTWRLQRTPKHSNTWCTSAIRHCIFGDVIALPIMRGTFCPKYVRGIVLQQNGQPSPDCIGGVTRMVDIWILGNNRIYQNPTAKAIYETSSFDPEGILGSATTVFQVFLGIQAGQILLIYSDAKSRLKRWSIWSIVTLICSLALSSGVLIGGPIPVNKNLWSLSFVLITSAAAFFVAYDLLYTCGLQKNMEGESLLPNRSVHQ
ncbi:Heparan-alpha-glucosaminide N-acetyltransferase, partial [Armadillidium nasatum]